MLNGQYRPLEFGETKINYRNIKKSLIVFSTTRDFVKDVKDYF